MFKSTRNITENKNSILCIVSCRYNKHSASVLTMKSFFPPRRHCVWMWAREQNSLWPTPASSRRSCWAASPGSPLCQARVWSRGGRGSESCPPQACTSAAKFRRRASLRRDSVQTRSPEGEGTQRSITDSWKNIFGLVIFGIKKKKEKEKAEMLRTHLRAVGLHHMAQHEEGDVKEQGPNGGRLGWKREAATGATGQSQVTRSSLELVPLSYSNLHPSPLMCFGNSLSLRRQKKTIVRRGFVSIGWAQHSTASFDSLNKLACKGLELPGGCRSSQQQIQALSGQHVSQHPQKALGGLGVVRVYCLMKERKCFTSCQHAIWKLSSPFRLLITGTRAKQ